MNQNEIIKQHFSKLGSKGGKAKASKRTPEQRKEDMKKVWEASRLSRIKKKIKIIMNEQAKENTRVDLQLKAMEMHTLIETGRGFDVFRVYNGWLYIHRGTLNQTFVPEFYNVNADCRNGN